MQIKQEDALSQSQEMMRTVMEILPCFKVANMFHFPQSNPVGLWVAYGKAEVLLAGMILS